jgi:hypothetical protein
MAIIHANAPTNRQRNLISIENTKFIFRTNFSGDPERDTFGSEMRKGNLIIPTYEQAEELMAMGMNVKQTKPKPGEEDDFVPTYFVAVNVNYDTEWPPKIYLVSGNAEPVLLDESSIDLIDKCYVLNVNAVLNPYVNKKTGRGSLYVRTMYVEQDIEDDPFAHRYARPASTEEYDD